MTTTTPLPHTQGTPTWITTRDGRQLYARILPGAQSSGDGQDADAGTPGSPGVTVVLETGAAVQRSTWAPVQTGIAALPGVDRVVVYDRSGLGRSAPGPDGRTLSRMADDLNDVLDSLDAPGSADSPCTSTRFILSGHSAGGPIVRLAASRRPDRIAGLVLVDPSDEAITEMTGRLFRTLEIVGGNASVLLAKLGLLRRAFGWLLDAMPADDVRADLAAEGFTPQVFRTQLAQARTFMPEVTTWRSDPPYSTGSR